MDYRIILRSRWGMVFVGLVSLAGLASVVLALTESNGHLVLQVLSVALSVIFFCWWYWAWPQITLERVGVTVRNMVRTIQIPWADIASADVRMGLYLRVRTDSGREKKIFVAGVPAAGGFTSAWRRRKQTLAAFSPTEGVTQVLNLEPVEARRLIEEEMLYQTGRSQRPGHVSSAHVLSGSAEAPGHLSVRWNIWNIACQAILVLWASSQLFLF